MAGPHVPGRGGCARLWSLQQAWAPTQPARPACVGACTRDTYLRDLSDEGSDTPDDLAAQRRAAQTEVHSYLFAFAAPSAGAGPLITHVHVTPFTQADAGQVVWPTLVCSDL